MLTEIVAKFVGALKLLGLCLCVVLLAGLGWSGLRAVRAKGGAARQGEPRLVAGMARVTGVPKAVAAAPFATLTVTSTGDGAANAANCPGANCRLRDALAKALAGDTISFSVTGTITLTQGELVINKNLTINGPGADLLTVSGNQAGRVFNINSNVTATFDRLTIANGKAGASNINLTDRRVSFLGGGIYNNGTLHLTNSTLSDNRVEVNSDYPGFIDSTLGAGIYNNGGVITLVNSTLARNQAVGGYLVAGGGIYNNGGSVTVSYSTLVSNVVFGNNNSRGGGIANASGNVTVSHSTLVSNGVASLNVTSAGRGIYNEGDLTLINSTISNNLVAGTSIEGGSLFYASGNMTLANCTVANNSTGGFVGSFFGSGLVIGISSIGNVNVKIKNTIIAGNSGGDVGDPAHWITDLGNNLISGDPKLGPLQNNGGPTQTHALLSNSPGRNAGDNCVLTNTCAGFTLPFNLTTDQRGTGFPRQFGSAVDIGAFEAQPLDSTPPDTTIASGPPR